ncbi:hypothetical protein M2244_004139 [Rhodoferax antarcticus]|nr:hypothetical protein [Rhodoferax antarcticus]
MLEYAIVTGDPFKIFRCLCPAAYSDQRNHSIRRKKATSSDSKRPAVPIQRSQPMRQLIIERGSARYAVHCCPARQSLEFTQWASCCRSRMTAVQQPNDSDNSPHQQSFSPTATWNANGSRLSHLRDATNQEENGSVRCRSALPFQVHLRLQCPPCQNDLHHLHLTI